MKFEELVNKEVESELKRYDEAIEIGKELRSRLIEQYKGNYSVNVFKTEDWIKFGTDENYGKYWFFFTHYSDGKEKTEKMVRDHYKKIQNKVVNKVGNILEMSDATNGYDFHIKGDKASCDIELIGAGGYNVQRYHMRWIIKNLKSEA